MLTLARCDRGEVIAARTIAQQMSIPARFLPQVLGDLNRAGLVEAQLGRSGGYRLAKPSSSISLLDIIEATEGDTRRQSCVLTGAPCGIAHETCEVHAYFFEAQTAMLERLSGTTVADVLAGAGWVSLREMASATAMPVGLRQHAARGAR